MMLPTGVAIHARLEILYLALELLNYDRTNLPEQKLCVCSVLAVGPTELNLKLHCNTGYRMNGDLSKMLCYAGATREDTGSH